MMVLIACQRERKQLVDIFGGSKNVALLMSILRFAFSSFAAENPNKIPLREKKKN